MISNGKREILISRLSLKQYTIETFHYLLKNSELKAKKKFQKKLKYDLQDLFEFPSLESSHLTCFGSMYIYSS